MGWTILMVACSLWRRRSRLLDARSPPARHPLVTHSSLTRRKLVSSSFSEQGVEGWAAFALVSSGRKPLYCNDFRDQARFSGGHN